MQWITYLELVTETHGYLGLHNCCLVELALAIALTAVPMHPEMVAAPCLLDI
jgi:hypothetical protein